MAHDHIVVRGARVHNLRGLDVDIPREALTVVTGVSGSGKSSLAFDTIYKEGQRRFLDSLSPYARQFLGQVTKPDVDHLDGLSPAVCVDQKTAGRSRRSTVGTLTETLDHLRLLFARLGTAHCPSCGRVIESQTAEQIAERLTKGQPGRRVLVLAPVVRARKGEYRKELEQLFRDGYQRARIDGEIRQLGELIELDRYVRHTIEVVVDRLVLEPGVRRRLEEAVERALELADGVVSFLLPEDGPTPELHLTHASARACPDCGFSLPEVEPRLFSFNHPQGACPACNGLGERRRVAEHLIVPDATRALQDGALACLTDDGKVPFVRFGLPEIEAVGRVVGFDLDTPWQELSEAHRRLVLDGSGDETFHFEYSFKKDRRTIRRDYQAAFRGVIPALETSWRFTKARFLEKWMLVDPCPDCEGTRLGPAGRAVTFRGRRLPELVGGTVDDILGFLAGVELADDELAVGRPVLQELLGRLGFLQSVGLGYLTLDRRANTLAGGEAQRIRLAAQVGSGLQGVLYVLDEPSIGLHARDQARLLDTLRRLRDAGNTVLVVEHDEATIRAADHVIDVGPGAGRLGGALVAEGSPETVSRSDGPTGRFLAGADDIPLPAVRRDGNGNRLRIVGARHHNLKDVTVEVPLGVLCCVTGVSGSGKSTLVDLVLRRALTRALGKGGPEPGRHRRLKGAELLDKVIVIDQTPIGRTPRSNPATYTKLFDPIRQLFAAVPEARARGYEPGRFSFNVRGGRCEECQGAGVRLVEMQFLPDVAVPCEACDGWRFNAETLEIRWQGRSIADVLDLTVDQAAEVFAPIPKAFRVLAALQSVGMGYVRLGQPSTTLSGGEAQRVKLARELRRPATGRTLYLLDEPTTGLHHADVRTLLAALDRLVEAGNSVVVIEHNLDVVRVADHVIDLGPEGGEGGGRVVVAGTPEEVAACAQSHTGEALGPALEAGRGVAADRVAEAPLPYSARPPSSPVGGPRDLVLRGARKHNLKDVDVTIPGGRMTVVTGVSGSGKTSLAFDTVFAEGQRRYVESLSTYARRFLGRLEKADCDALTGLAPAISIDQKTASKNPRSTVATVTEIHDHLRLLYARVGTPHCHECGEELRARPPSAAAREVGERLAGRRVLVTAPRRDEACLGDVAGQLLAEGHLRAVVDGRIVDLGADLTAEQAAATGFAVVVDRLEVDPAAPRRLAEALEAAYGLGGGRARVEVAAGPGRDAGVAAGEGLSLTAAAECVRHGHRVPDDPSPRRFSFNHHHGACPECDGLGTVAGLHPDVLVKDPDAPLLEGGLYFETATVFFHRRIRAALEAACAAHGVALDEPVARWSEADRRVVFRGTGDREYEAVVVRNGRRGRSESASRERWPGLLALARDNPWVMRHPRVRLGQAPCPLCRGKRLRPESLAVTLGGLDLPDLCALTVGEARAFLAALELGPTARQVAEDPLAEVDSRLSFLEAVGLSYLTLDRSAATLSGGEAQRIRLASQLGARLSGCIYVLDEPTRGLHPRDTERLVRTLHGLRDIGNTVLVVEHDPDVIRAADHVVDLGPAAGEGGGHVVAAGPPDELARSGNGSLTGAFLSGERSVPVPPERRPGRPGVRVIGACAHNLAGIDVDFPQSCLTVVTGVSGSGKSSLVLEVLLEALRVEEQEALLPGLAGPWSRVEGVAAIRKVMAVDQSPIGRSPRSNPATYTGILTRIRELFARVPEARARGFAKGRFSFNVPGGRCEACEGQGASKVEMHFLSDVWIPCEACRGRRFNRATLEVRYRGLTIADVLDLEVARAREVFANHRGIRRVLDCLNEVGLGYLRLGQAANTLSGGEAQRLKLSSELARPACDGALYVLDEPTTGLHAADVERLVAVLHRLADRGAAVVVIEHNLDVVKVADRVVDLGPEGGDAGGEVVVAGTPEEVAAHPTSHTGRHLRRVLRRQERPRR